ncbi:MAG: autotransporter-associated beta strand repeat-containing protein [Burkholderiales bacterium]|jgi:autotransporter-associated beta strand protein|nr:autotransporter-associated beta strand repeat-containing protein [Burkholderiales bacterium]
MPNSNSLSKRGSQKHHIRLFSLGLSAALCFTATATFAVCDNHTPATGDTVTCDATPPNPDTTGVHAATPSTNVTITINLGASISTTGAAVRVHNASTVTNNGSVTTTTSLASAYGIWAGDPGNSTSTTAGYGNILTNNGNITTAAAGSAGLYARTRHATAVNTLINSGTITTSGGMNGARSASGIRTESRESSTIDNSGTVTTTGAGGNGIEMIGPGTIVNAGTVTSNQGYGVLGSDLTQGATTYSGVTLNNSGTISGATGAISLGTGADTVIIRSGSVLAGTINGGGVSPSFTGQDRLIFNGFFSADFDNTVVNFNLLQVTGNTDVGLSAADYSFDQIQIDIGSSLTFIDTALTASSGIVNDGVLTFSNPTPNAFSGPISGNGDLFKQDTGIFTLSGVNTYSGSTTVDGGTLQAGALGAFSPNTDVIITVGATLDLNDFSQTVLALTNNGSISMGAVTAGTQLIADDYIGGGIITMSAILDATPSSDKLIINDTVTGSTTLHITNLGGVGAQTTGDGVLVIDASGAVIAPGASFVLAAPLVAGGYQYMLYQGGIGGSNPQNWYLRNTSRASTTAIPALSPAALALTVVALRIRSRKLVRNRYR